VTVSSGGASSPGGASAPGSARDALATYKALCVVAWIWAAVGAVATIVYAVVFLPRLPSEVAYVVPALGRGAQSGAYLASPVTLFFVSLGVIVAFAVVILVVRLLAAPSRILLPVLLVVLDALVAVGVVVLFVGPGAQLDHASALSTSAAVDSLDGLSWVLGIVAIVLALASALFIGRRLTLGRWRAATL